MVVEFVTVAVAFVDDERAVEMIGRGADHELAGLPAQAHGAAFAGDVLLLVEQRDHRMRRVGIKFGRVRAFEFENVAGEFDGGDLHAETKAEIGNLFFARILRGQDFALDAAFPKTARNQNAAQALEDFFRAKFFDLFGLDFFDFHRAIVGHAAVHDGFIDGFVGVVQLDVFAHHADADAVARGDELADDLLPVRHVGRRACPDAATCRRGRPPARVAA